MNLFRLLFIFLFSTSATFWLTSSSYDLNKLLYDDSYLTNNLNGRYPYLKLPNGGYVGPKDYFNFTNVYEPNLAYYETVNIEEHLFEELKSMEIGSSIATMDQWHYSNKETSLEFGSPEANKRKCLQELEYITGELNRATKDSSYLFQRGLGNIQMIKYIDTFGRPPSETYFGHSYWVGSYRGCLNSHLLPPAANDTLSAINLRYCWGKLRAKDWPEVGGEGDVIPPVSFRVGLCLPNSCDTETANEQRSLVQQIMVFNFSPLHRDRFNKLFDIYCLPTGTLNQNQLSLPAKLFVTSILLWLGIIMMLSIYRFTDNPVELNATAKTLTIQENLARYFNDDSPPTSHDSPTARVDLRPIGIIKFFASIAIIVGHLGCSVGWVFNSSTFSITMNARKVSRLYFMSCMKSVDWFMVIGGLLTSFTIVRKFQANKINSIVKPKVYLSFIVIRYLRLTPIFVIIATFLKTIYVHLGEGPMWDYGTYNYSMQGRCQQSSWWRLLVFPILFSLNGNSYQHECLPVSWYVITDLKLSLVTPLLVYLFCKQRNTWSQIMISILPIAVSTLSQYKDLTMQQMVYFKHFFTYSPLIGTNMLSLAFGEPGYFSAINRSHAFIMGLLCGIILHKYQQNGIKLWPFFMRGWFLKAMIVYQVYDYFAPLIAFSNYLQTKNIPSEETIKLAMLLKPRIDAIIFAILTLRAVTDCAQSLMRFSQPLYKLSKLSYCVFFIHSIVIAYAVSSNEKSRPDSLEIQFLMLLAFVTCSSFIISFPMYILFESPIALLLNSFISKPPPPTSSTSTTATTTMTESHQADESNKVK